LTFNTQEENNLIGDESDDRMRRSVTQELDWDPKISGHTVAVEAHGGAVTLSGGVHSYGERLAAVRAAERVYGVRVVTDEIAVNLPDSSTRDDEEISEEITRIMRWSSAIPDMVKADVSHGLVTLRGTVEWTFQSIEAERAIRYLVGIRGINNLIAVKSTHPRVSDVRKSVHEAIGRMADVDARSVWVTSTDGTVHLRGRVHSLAQWRTAGRAAASAPGMERVVNDIVVTP
jgi:osmotically-inducible protein OsmY